MVSHIFSTFKESSTHALVIGAGRSGIAATKLLMKHDVPVVLYDDRDEGLRFLQASGLRPNSQLSFAFARAPDNKHQIGAVILSPGVPLEHHLVQWAQSRNLPVWSEIDLGSLVCEKKLLIGITGTNGKSTTTVMMNNILLCAGLKSIACGNLGRPFCDVLLDNDDIDAMVLELSSFQLESSSHLVLDGAIIINITHDHLDRHRDFASYENAKLKIGNFLKPKGCLVAHEDLASKIVHDNRAQFFSGVDYAHKLNFLSDARILGLHNQENAVAAAALSLRLGIEKSAIINGLKTFSPLPHRCEFIGKKSGVQFINDSKGTTVLAVTKALSLVEEPVHLLLGGITKGESFSILARSAFPQIQRYYVYGRDRQKIIDDLPNDVVQVYDHLTDAFYAAMSNAKAGETILLSPGCASYDQFDDYQHRGEVFRALAVGEL